jgi:hypothetical protein
MALKDYLAQKNQELQRRKEVLQKVNETPLQKKLAELKSRTAQKVEEPKKVEEPAKVEPVKPQEVKKVEEVKKIEEPAKTQTPEQIEIEKLKQTISQLLDFQTKLLEQKDKATETQDIQEEEPESLQEEELGKKNQVAAEEPAKINLSEILPELLKKLKIPEENKELFLSVVQSQGITPSAFSSEEDFYSKLQETVTKYPVLARSANYPSVTGSNATQRAKKPDMANLSMQERNKLFAKKLAEI